MAQPEEDFREPVRPPSEQEDVEEVLPWEEQTRIRQQQYLQWLGQFSYSSFRKRIPSICNLLLDRFCKCQEGDGCCENNSELMLLKAVIGYALYGPPSEDATEENRFTGYPKDKLEPIEKIYEQIVKHQNSNKVLMGMLYISLENSGKVVDSIIFRIPNPNHVEGGVDEYWFVDFAARLYKNWDDFLSNNKLPASKCCYPKDGVYTGDPNGSVELCYGFTPAAKLSGKALNSLDIVATVTSVGAGIGAFFPPVAVPCVAACGVVSIYTAVRGSVELADRGTHGQSLVDRESARQWISIVGSTLGLGSAGGMAAIKMLAREGKTASDLVCGFVTGLNVSSMFVNGVGIVENIITIKEQDEWSALQIFQLTTSVMFFSHSIVNFKTARSVYVETQNQILDDHGASLSKRLRKLFNGMQSETLNGEPDVVVGKAKIIKDLNHIGNKNEFFARILRSNKTARTNSEPVTKVKFGNLSGLQEGQSHTSSSMGSFSQHSTILASSQGKSVGNTTPQYVNPHEPALFTNIRMFLQNIPSCEIDRLLILLGTICDKWKYGRNFMDILRIVIDIKHCNNMHDVIRIVKAIMNFGNDLWEDFIKSRLEHAENLDSQGFSPRPSEAQVNEDEEMGRIMENVSFIPGVLHGLSSKELEEDVFHFPTDHRVWGGNGELEPDEYILIGQNAFGIANIECANVRHEDDTASVYFEHVGLVTITSYVKDHKLVVKKFPKCYEQ